MTSTTIYDPSAERDTPALLPVETAPRWPTSILAGVACYDGMTAAERARHIEEWTAVRDPDAGLVEVPVQIRDDALYLPGDVGYVYADTVAAAMAGLRDDPGSA